MKKEYLFPLVLLLSLIFLPIPGWADGLPDLPKQELWVKLVSMVVGLAIIFPLCIMGLNKLLYGVLGIEADNAAKISVMVAILVSFLWFLYLFGQIFDTMVNIALGVLLTIIALVYFLRDRENSSSAGSEGQENIYTDDNYY